MERTVLISSISKFSFVRFILAMLFIIGLNAHSQTLVSSPDGIRVPQLSSAPGTPVVGQMYYNTSTGKLMVYIVSSWVELGASGGGDFLADGTVAMTGNFRLGNNWLSNDGDAEGIRITTDGKVGIGLGNPWAPLHVYHATDPYLAFTSSSNITGAFLGIDANSFYLWQGENKAMSFGTNNTERMRIQADGKVGVGTSTPNHLLEVGGNIASQNHLIFRQSNSASNLIDGISFEPYFWDNTAGSEGTGLGVQVRDGNGAWDYVLDFSDRLYVYNPIEAHGNWTYLNRRGDNAYGHWIEGFKSRGTSGSPTPVQSGDALLNVGGFGWNGTDYGINAGAVISFVATENYSATNQGAKLEFYSTPNGSTASQNRMVIDQNGNVGIATISPNRKLRVNGDFQATSLHMGDLAPAKHTYVFNRAEMPYATVAANCGGGSRPIAVRESDLGKTGSQICATDNASDGPKQTCYAVRYHYITVGGGIGYHSAGDQSCSSNISVMWPWMSFNQNNSYSSEWIHGTHVVCCTDP